jgi:YkoP domain
MELPGSILPAVGRVNTFMTRSRRPPWVAPSVIDPLLGLVERVDRRLRRISPVRDGSLLGIEPTRHHGPDLTLTDGTAVHDGSPLWTVHFDNARLRALAGEGWQTRAYAVADADLHEIAARVSRLPADARPVALYGVTLLAALTRRVGFELRDRKRTARVRLEDWYLRSLLARWSPAGRSRLRRGHGALRTREAWQSAGELLRRYGPPPPP